MLATLPVLSNSLTKLSLIISFLAQHRRSLSNKMVYYKGRRFKSRGHYRNRLMTVCWQSCDWQKTSLITEGAPQEDSNCQTVTKIRPWAPARASHQDTDWLTDCQSQRHFDFEFMLLLIYPGMCIIAQDPWTYLDVVKGKIIRQVAVAWSV
jgi:hypothetical protein